MAVAVQGNKAGSDATRLSFGVVLARGVSDELWTKVSADNHLWQRQLPSEVYAAGAPRQLWLATPGTRMTRARQPNTGSNFKIPLDGALPGNAVNGFAYTDGDLNRPYGNISEVEVVVYASWSASRHYIQQLNTSAEGGLTVTFTSNCLNPPAGMWPNSGNRYYLENDRTFVDAPSEFHIDSMTGVITLYPPDNVTDPNDVEWIVDSVHKTGVQIKDTTIAPPVLLLNTFTGGSPPVLLPASRLPLAGDCFNISFKLQLPVGTAAGQLLSRGPPSFKHVPGDMSLSVAGHKLVMDVGWQCTLFGHTQVCEIFYFMN